MQTKLQITLALFNIIGAVLTLTGPIGVIGGLSILFGGNGLSLVSASRVYCQKKPTGTDST